MKTDHIPFLTLEVGVAGCQVHLGSRELGHPVYVEGKRKGERIMRLPFSLQKYKQSWEFQVDKVIQHSAKAG